MKQNGREYLELGQVTSLSRIFLTIQYFCYMKLMITIPSYIRDLFEEQSKMM